MVWYFCNWILMTTLIHLESVPLVGFVPGANGSPFLRPSGVFPFLPYITLLVIVVGTDSVWNC